MENLLKAKKLLATPLVVIGLLVMVSGVTLAQGPWEKSPMEENNPSVKRLEIKVTDIALCEIPKKENLYNVTKLKAVVKVSNPNPLEATIDWINFDLFALYNHEETYIGSGKKEFDVVVKPNACLSFAVPTEIYTYQILKFFFFPSEEPIEEVISKVKVQVKGNALVKNGRGFIENPFECPLEDKIVQAIIRFINAGLEGAEELPKIVKRFYPDIALGRTIKDLRASLEEVEKMLGSLRRPHLLRPKYNHPPVAYDQSITTIKGKPLNVTLTASDVDKDLLTYSIVTNPLHGSLSGTVPDVIYTPGAGYTGQDSFTFKVNDGKSDSNIATVSIIISVYQIFIEPKGDQFKDRLLPFNYRRDSSKGLSEGKKDRSEAPPSKKE